MSQKQNRTSHYDDELRELRNRLLKGTVAMVVLTLVGAGGFRLLAPDHGWLDAIYMTVITLTTVGFGEIEGSGTGVRLFTIFLLVFGLGIFTYFVTTAAVLVFEGHLHNVFWRRRMEKQVSRLNEHYIVCGSGETALQAASELRAVGRDVVIVIESADRLEAVRSELPGTPIVVGDPTTDLVLGGAGVGRAAGVIACTPNDKDNLIITLTARRARSSMRIVAQVDQMAMADKIRNVGADAVVSPSHIGGLRMASELIRPTTVSFLDQMLRDRDKNLRMDEVAIPDESPIIGTTIADLDLRAASNALLVAACLRGDWIYNPSADFVIQRGTVLIFMGAPSEVDAVRAHVGSRTLVSKPEPLVTAGDVS